MDHQAFFAQLDRFGLHTQEALNRFMGNEALFLSFVGRLPEKLSFAQIHQGLEEENEDVFYMHVHNLKGMAGNLSIEPLYDCAQAILVEFRASKFTHKKKLTALVQEAEGISQSLAGLIGQYLAEEKAQ